jgi:hypothetical protein
LAQAGLPKCASTPALPTGYTKDARGDYIYNQYDPRWSNISYDCIWSTTGTSGCGPAAMAMIITKLTGVLVTPADTVPVARVKGLNVCNSGSSHTLPNVLAPIWGLKATNVAVSESNITNALKAGQMVWTCGTGAAPFTTNGHCIGIRGIAANGNWLVFNSNGSASGATSDTSYSPASIINTIRSSGISTVTVVSK